MPAIGSPKREKSSPSLPGDAAEKRAQKGAFDNLKAKYTYNSGEEKSGKLPRGGGAQPRFPPRTATRSGVLQARRDGKAAEMQKAEAQGATWPSWSVTTRSELVKKENGVSDREGGACSRGSWRSPRRNSPARRPASTRPTPSSTRRNAASGSPRPRRAQQTWSPTRSPGLLSPIVQKDTDRDIVALDAQDEVAAGRLAATARPPSCGRPRLVWNRPSST